MKKVLGMGAALVDMVVRVDDAWITKTGKPKGGMTLVDFAEMKQLLGGLLAPTLVPGGSACNTMVGIARLGGVSSFIAKVGKDSLGEVFETHLADSKVESKLGVSSVATGCVLAAVTPDAQRTMFTYLGASNDLSPVDIVPALFKDVALFYLEGYRAYDAKTFKLAMEMARAQGAMTALDFGSFGVVNDCRPLFDTLFQEKSVDIVIANEDEARAYTGLEEESALKKLAKSAPIAVVKLGSRGALISKNGEVTCVEARPVHAVDTTGAGDLWASGFLFGLLSGWDMKKSGLLASLVASEVVQVLGPGIPEDGWNRIQREMSVL
jgi:sugar/nucleoside kinase (ribokinase family)